MNGVTGSHPVRLRIYMETEEGILQQFVEAYDAKVEVINPATIKARLEKLKNTINETIENNYLQPLYKIDMDEEGKRNEEKAFVLDNTDATYAINTLYTQAKGVPKMMCDAVDPFYAEAVEVCARYQRQFNNDAWEAAQVLRRNMGENARIEEVYSTGGGN